MITLKEKILEEYTIFIAGHKDNSNALNTNPFNIPTKFIDIVDKNNKIFLDLLNQLDGISYGNKNLAMPKWVGLDCGLLPSVFIGLAKPKDQTEDKILKKFSIPSGYKGLIPISEFCALQKLENKKNNTMVVHTLACIEQNKGLGFATEVVGFKIYNAHKIFSIAQYNNHAIKIHSKIANLNLITTTTPMHELSDQTFIYECNIPTNLEKLLVNGNIKPKKYDFLLNPNNKTMKNLIQKNISEKIAEYHIVYPGQIYQNHKLYITLIQKIL